MATERFAPPTPQASASTSIPKACGNTSRTSRSRLVARCSTARQHSDRGKLRLADSHSRARPNLGACIRFHGAQRGSLLLGHLEKREGLVEGDAAPTVSGGGRVAPRVNVENLLVLAWGPHASCALKAYNLGNAEVT